MKEEAASNEFLALDDALGELEFGEIEIIAKLEGDDDPLNWSLMARWMYTIIVVKISGIVGFSSSVYSPAISSIAESLHVSNLMSTLGSTTFLIGSAVGPLLFAPLSEIWGRNPLYYGSFLLFCLAILGCALAQNITTLLVCRFFAGLFGLPPVANTGGSITDLWPQSHRSVPLALYTAACFCAPVLGSIVGGFLTQNLSWRWTSWVVLIVATATYIIMVIALPETYAPRLLEIKNAKAGINTRKRVGNTPFTQSLMRPWIMLFTEPILFSLSLYMAFIYGVLYPDFTAYPVVFQKARGWSIGISGLAFTGIGAGMAIATSFSPYVNKIYSHYKTKLGPVPEARLPHLIPIVWLLPIGIFWFGWTALPPTHWIVPIIAGVPFGFALVMLFLGINAYLTDCYDRFSASALAANTMLRCLFGAGFAVFATTMYEKLGTPWATSILGFVAVALGILPFVFYRFGAKLRAASKFHIYVTSHN